MDEQEAKPGAQDPGRILLAPRDYVREVLDTFGDILQANIIGSVTLITAYRDLGNFECVRWDRSGADFDKRDEGELIASHETLESANGFHYAIAQAHWAGPWGTSTRERAEWFEDEALVLVRP